MTKDYRKISELHNWEHNPRSVTKQGIERLIKQIKKLGVYKPLLITKDGTVLGGNMRLKALEQMGMKDVWVSVVEADTEEKKIEYALSDNDRVGKYEGDQLADLIGNFPQVEWNDYAVDIKEPQLVSDIMDQFKEVVEDEVPEVPKVAESKLGEVYTLGRHRLMCGDATKIEDVTKLMDGKKADMVFTDPPYNIGFSYNEHKDKKTDEGYSNLLKTSFNNFPSNRSIITPGPRNLGYWYQIKEPSDIGTWIKRNSRSGATLFHFRRCEPILFYGEFDNKRNDDVFDFSMENYKDISEIESPIIGEKHAPAKPMRFIVNLIKDFSKENTSVYDCFGGTGTTLIACEQTNRTCYMMEIDPLYCDVIRKRYDNFVQKTGQEQEKNAK